MSEPGFSGLTDDHDWELEILHSCPDNKHYLLNGTLEFQTHNPANLPIWQILVKTMAGHTDPVLQYGRGWEAMPTMEEARKMRDYEPPFYNRGLLGDR